MADDAVAATLDAAVASGQTPGLAYAAVDAAGVVAEHAAGYADIARRQPMTIDTTLMAYSMTKTITAAAVLQLADGGTLRLDDRLAAYVPESPYGGEVTIAQLISHTGGIPNPIPLRWVHPAAAHAGFDERAALDAVLRAHPRLARRPGRAYRYSNIGYWLLGRVIERVSGRCFDEHVTRDVFAPLRAAADQLSFTIPAAAAHATGYLEKYSLMNLLKRLVIDADLIGRYEGRWLRIAPHYPNGPAFGGIVGTVRGFGRFLQDQLRPSSVLFGRSARQAFYTQQTASGGRPVPMTLGWHREQVAGEPVYFKEGGGGGFHCMMRLYPRRGIGSVLMTNATGLDVARLLRRVNARRLS